MKIVNLVKAGEDKEIEAVMKTIHNQNFGNRELSVSMIKQLMYELRGTVLKIAEQLEFVEFDAHEYGVSELVEKFDSISSAEDKLNNITSILLKMANSVEKRKKSKNSKLKQDLLNYINENYMNSSLTMIEVAEKIGIASGYLAHFIKEQTGESFSSYLETIRMKKSREFLSQDLTVNEVMKRVGYNNQSTFFKAFKRVYGMTPTMLRSVEKNIM
jgi:YesN/AraC family two-component response regulator